MYTKILNSVSFIFEGQIFCAVLNFELFIKMYEAIDEVNDEVLKALIYSEAMEALNLKAEASVLRKCDVKFNTYSGVLMHSDLSDLRYLFHYGHFIGDDEIKTARYLLELTEEKIERMANVFTDAFYKGYLKGHKEMPLSEKKTIQLAYPIGFERVVKKAAQIFAASGLEPIVHNDVFTASRPRLMSTKPSEQYAYDHRFDEAIFFDEAYAKALETTYAHYMKIHQEAVKSLAGIALQECFGQPPFSPKSKTTCLKYEDVQTSLKTAHTTSISKIKNTYYPASIWSFVIIAYPLPSIGEAYTEIFDEVIKVNTFDSDVYDAIHQAIIDALDQGECVHVLGKGKNKTDIYVKLQTLNNPEKQTNFENCTADINVPVGEVFTSPELAGTTGTLHVSQVYLNDLKYINLELTFKDGMIDTYTCTNFESEEDNKNFVHENLMHPHKTLPLGEFAIGTNTAAAVMSKKYGIEQVMPILIAEKMGPHFAIGDTCFAWSEDICVYNSDGKEILARDNEKSRLRKTDLSQAYTNKHTDITIPYDELALIAAITKEGKSIPIIVDGRFVLPGTQYLNEPFNV